MYPTYQNTSYQEPGYQNPGYPDNGSKQFKLRIMLIGLALLALVIILVVTWIAGHSYITIDASGAPDNSAINYTLTDARGNQSTFKSNASHYRKQVAKGSYQIVVSAGNTNYAAVVAAKSFLGTTHVDAKLQPEAARSVVGSNPGSCMYYSNEVLISGQCVDRLSNLSLHVPGTATQPSYIGPLPKAVRDYSDGTQIAHTKNGYVGLTVFQQTTESKSAGYYLYALRPDFSLGSQTASTGLSPSTYYSIQAYKDGFVVFDSSFKTIYTYNSIQDSPQAIKLAAPANTNLKPTALQAADNAIVAIFVQRTGGQGGDDESAAANNKGTTAVVVHTDNSDRQYTFNKVLTAAEACGSQKLCVVSKNALEVYDISGKTQKLLYSWSDVSEIRTDGQNLLAINPKGVVALNVDDRVGYLQYTFGDSQACGWGVADNGYVLCVLDPYGKREALYINPGAKDTNSIDKKIAPLTKVQGVTGVSVYKNFIYIVPNYGKQVYNPAIRGFDYDPNTRKTVNTAINQAVEKSGIDLSQYHVINLGY